MKVAHDGIYIQKNNNGENEYLGNYSGGQNLQE